MWTSEGGELLCQLHLLVLKRSQSLRSHTVLLVTYPALLALALSPSCRVRMALLEVEALAPELVLECGEQQGF